MAATLTIQDAWSVTRQQYPVGLDPMGLEYATNMAINEMWMAYDWRGTVQPFNPFWLVPGECDYGKPFYVVPPDFYGFREVYLVSVGSNNQVRNEILVQENLQRTGYLDFPRRICYREAVATPASPSGDVSQQRASGGVFRVWPCPTYGMASPLYLIDGTYKVRPPKVVRANFNTLIPWDDIYFNTFCQACAWAALVAGGRRQEALAQYQIFGQAMDRSTMSENRELGEPAVHPSEGLFVTRTNMYLNLP